METPTDEQLLGDHLLQNPGAFDKLVKRHHRELYQFVLRFTNSPAAAEDVVQNAFLQVHLSAAGFDRERRFKPWLFAIAANKARDWLRRRSRQDEVPLDAFIDGGQEGGQRFADLLAAAEPPEDALLERDEQRAAVRSVVERMPTLLREVLVLAYYHQFPYREMAGVLGIPLGTVKSRLHAAVACFGKKYKESIRESHTDELAPPTRQESPG